MLCVGAARRSLRVWGQTWNEDQERQLDGGSEQETERKECSGDSTSMLGACLACGRARVLVRGGEGREGRIWFKLGRARQQEDKKKGMSLL